MHPFILRFLVALPALLLALAIAPTMALADVPGTRGDDTGPQGGLSQHAAPEPVGNVANAIWQDVTPLPTTQSRTAQTDTWLSRSLNPGVWMLNSTMGASAAHIQTIAELTESIVTTIAPNGNVLPTSCGNDNIVVCTPANLTYDHPKMRVIWDVLKPVALALITLLFVWRMFGLINEGPTSLAAEGKNLAGTFFMTMLFVTQAQWILGMLIDLFNAISSALLGSAGMIVAPVSASAGSADLGLGAALMALAFWIAAGLLTLKSFFRVVSITILVGIAPLAGALLMHKATASRFQSWLNKLIDLLVEQVALALMLALAAAMLDPVKSAAGVSPWNGYSDQVFGILTLIMAVTGQTAALGFVHAVPASYLETRLKMQALGMAGKALSPLHKPALAGAAALGAAGLGAAALGAAAPVAAAAGLGAGALTAGGVGVRSIRRWATQRRNQRMDEQLDREVSDARRTDRIARRTLDQLDTARNTAYLEARRGGQSIGLAGREIRHRRANRERAARGDRNGVIMPRTQRYSTRGSDGGFVRNTRGAARVDAYRNGIATAGALLRHERHGLSRRVQADEARLSRVRDRMASDALTGDDPDARLQARASVLEQRIQARRDRLAAIDPTTEQGRAEQRRVGLALGDRALPTADRRDRLADAVALERAQRGAAQAMRPPRPAMQQARMTVNHAMRHDAKLAVRALKSAEIPRRQRRLSPVIAGSLRRAEALPPAPRRQPARNHGRNTRDPGVRPPPVQPTGNGSSAGAHAPPAQPARRDAWAQRRERMKDIHRQVRDGDGDDNP